MARLRKILVPTDFSEIANHAVDYAVKLVAANQAKLVLLTVIEDLPLTDSEMQMLRVSVDSMKEYNRKHLNAAREKLRKLISPSILKRLRVEFMVRDGKPFAEIIENAFFRFAPM